MAFRRRLDSALRAGHGLGAEFVFLLRAGAEPTLYLEARSAAARRWVTRALLPAYERSQWRTCRFPGLQRASAELQGRRVRSWPQSLRGLAEGSTILDVWALTFTSFSSDLDLELAFRPTAVGPLRWWEVHGPATEDFRPAVPTVGRPGPTAASHRSSVPLPPPRPPTAWIVQARLACGASHDAWSRIRAAAGSLERAARNDLGNGIVFRRSFRWPHATAGGFLVVSEELNLFLPGPECPVVLPERPSNDRDLLPLGRTPAGTVVGPRLEPDQGRHLAVLGETGMGKSSLLVALARRASRSYGLVLLDPLGATAAAFERELGPDARERRVRIAPVVAPVRINALEGISSGERGDPVRSERRLNDLVYSLRRVRSGRYTDSSYWGPRLEEMLTRAIRAAAALPDGTLTDAHTLLESGARSPRAPPPLAMGPVRELAERIRDRPEDAEGARRLLHEIVRSPVLEPMLCARTPDLRPSSLVAPGRIVIVSGEAAEVGESTARYLLSVYLALIWSEVLARPSRSKLFVVLDEAQWFSHDSLAEMLRLGRSQNLHVVLATQAVASLPPPVAESVWTNVADFVAFRGSPEEAREFARTARGVSTEAILSLPRGHAVVLLGKGHATRWLRTLRLPDPPRPERPRGPRSEAPASTEAWDAGPAGPSAEDVLAVVRARARSLPPGDALRVALEELRQQVDPSGVAVRRAGSLLGQAGAILASERTAAGTVWTIAPARIPPPSDPNVGTGATGGSGRPQPS